MIAHPLAVCSTCGHFAWTTFLIDQPCSQRYHGSRCAGTNSAATHYTFRECPACGGTGNKCARCLGNRVIAERLATAS